MTCSFCNAAVAGLGPFEGVFVCDNCAKLIGALAFDNPSIAWSVAESGPMPPPLENHAESLAFLKEKLDQGKLIEEASDEPLPWADVVVAYTDRRLYHLAVRTCAVILKRGGATDKDAALGKLLTRPLLKEEGRAVLREVIRRKQTHQ